MHAVSEQLTPTHTVYSVYYTKYCNYVTDMQAHLSYQDMNGTLHLLIQCTAMPCTWFVF